MKTYCFVRQNGQLLKVNFDNIQLVEASRNYCKMIMDFGQVLLMLRTMKEIENFLPSSSFVRVHKSYIIPINRIKWVTAKSIQLESGQTVPVGEMFAEKVDAMVAGNLL